MNAEKPSYRTTKNIIWLSTISAWLVIVLLAAGAAWGGQTVEFGTIAVPSMVGVILGINGIHRGFGSWDMKTLAGQQLPPSSPPYNARDVPGMDERP